MIFLSNRKTVRAQSSIDEAGYLNICFASDRKRTGKLCAFQMISNQNIKMTKLHLGGVFGDK